MQLRKNIGRTILIAGLVLAALAVTVSTGAACGAWGACGGEGIEGHVEHIARDLCAMGSSVRLVAFAVIGLFLLNVVSLIASLKKTR